MHANTYMHARTHARTHKHNTLQVNALKARLASAEQTAQGASSREHELLGRVKALTEASATAASQHAKVRGWFLVCLRCCARAHIHTHARSHTHTCAHTYAYTHTHTYAYTHTHMCIHTYTHVCIHTYTHARIHT
jgi:hypothetical protein